MAKSLTQNIYANWHVTEQGSSMFLSVVFLPLVKKRVYNVFLKTHQGCALVALYAIWQHTHAVPNSDATFYVLACVGLFVLSQALQMVRVLFRNVVFGKERTTLILHSYEGNVARVTLSLPRPWTIHAGQRVELIVPYVGLLYLFQKHPFTISWWEEDDVREAFSISLLLRPRSGFTRKFLKRAKPQQEYRAWIEGPFGPASVSACGFSGEVGDYGHVFFIATGIGIAAQLPYIKELLNGHHQSRVRTKKVSLVWQLDQDSDWQSARDWLQMLVEQDEGYVSISNCDAALLILSQLLSVAVYDTLQPASTGDPRRIEHHGLIEVHGGVPNLAQQLSSEMKNQMGRMLVAGNFSVRVLSKQKGLTTASIRTAARARASATASEAANGPQPRIIRAGISALGSKEELAIVSYSIVYHLKFRRE
jgi:hypothetical protein